MSKLIFVLNGPNLNLLGTREPGIYGILKLDDIAIKLSRLAKGFGREIDFRQSNSEGDLVDWIHEAGEKKADIILNAGAYTHTSIALMDALLAVDCNCIEVHLSNIFKRESFRHNSFISRASTGIISGFGAKSYELALLALADQTS
ncbi:MAG: type II 3-dehydroquinate dehydratase [Hyphomicrobiaceae bacterium]|nr:type II 3-dehydroquinate dehydratase [Hyphomicrobiaceae bacterium]